jgi:methionine synthase II (cobalamin-independent)
MKRSTHRILTTHCGSLPRPNDLLEMLMARDQGRLHNMQAFHALEHAVDARAGVRRSAALRRGALSL